MATYNGARYIGAQLNSIADQTRQPDEVIIGDDRSSDETVAIVGEFSRNTRLPIRMQINQERLRTTGNFEQILSRCTGDIIVFSDQDDLWRRDKLQKIEDAFLEHPKAEYVFSNGSLIDGVGQRIKGSLWDRALFWSEEQALYQAGHGSRVLLRHNVVTGAAMAVRRSAVGMALPIPAGWIHDYWLAWVLEVLSPGVLIDEPLISYRIHAAQQTGLYQFSISKMMATIHSHDERYCRAEAESLRRLADQLERINASAQLVEGVREKIMFYERRADMRRHPWSAPAQILRCLWTGEYRRFTPRFRYALPAIPLDAAASALSLIAGRKKRRQESMRT